MSYVLIYFYKFVNLRLPGANAAYVKSRRYWLSYCSGIVSGGTGYDQTWL